MLRSSADYQMADNKMEDNNDGIQVNDCNLTDCNLTGCNSDNETHHEEEGLLSDCKESKTICSHCKKDSNEEDCVECGYCEEQICNKCSEIDNESKKTAVHNMHKITGVAWLCKKCYPMICEESTIIIKRKDYEEKENKYILSHTDNQSMKDEINKLRNTIKQLNSEIKSDKIEINANELKMEETKEKIEKMSKEHKQNIKEIKSMQTSIQTYKTTSEQYEGELIETKKTVSTLNTYISQLENINKGNLLNTVPYNIDDQADRISVSVSGEHEYESVTKRKEHDTSVSSQTWQKSTKRLIIRNLSSETEEGDIINLLGLNTTDYLKNTTNVEIITNEDGNKEAVIEVPDHVEKEIIKLNEIEFHGRTIYIGKVNINKQCFYYKKNGWCKLGEFCKYNHDNEDNGKISEQRKRKCRYYLLGKCKYGNNCRFEHSTDTCKYFKANKKCPFAGKCRYLCYGEEVVKQNDTKKYEDTKRYDDTQIFLWEKLEKKMADMQEMILQKVTNFIFTPKGGMMQQGIPVPQGMAYLPPPPQSQFLQTWG